jgi:hypothetical protein
MTGRLLPLITHFVSNIWVCRLVDIQERSAVCRFGSSTRGGPVKDLFEFGLVFRP